jgi:uncharacterized protein (TIGR00299 family) protein
MPERILYYDCSAGISGDMHLGAMVDLGVPAEHLESELLKLGLPGWRLHFQKDARKGISGTRADVLLDGDDSVPAPEGHTHTHGTFTHSHDGGPAHTHGPGHSHSHSHEGEGSGAHEHRSHRDIVAMITASTLPEATKARSLGIFARLAAAEGKIHGVPPEEVTFHEVGAVDSIVDIVAAAIALEWLRPDRIHVSPVELGSGFVKCAHGRLPVPAPATAELLRGAPVRSGAVPFEATTPTGAAILAASAHGFTTRMEFSLEKVGYGIGHKDGPVPNILRVFLGSAGEPSVPAADPTRESAVLLECNIDDMSGETSGYVIERLLAAGASDAWCVPILMKKSRPAITLSVLCRPADEDALARILLTETTTFGLRRREVGKTALQRSVEEADTPFGKVRVKSAWLDGKKLKSKPEHDDLRRLAAEHGVPLRTVEQAALAAIQSSQT